MSFRCASILLALAAVVAWSGDLATIAAAVPPPSLSAPVRALHPQAVQELVLFGDTRPVLLRLHLLIDGQSFRQAWDGYFEGLFAYLDRDGDGVLSAQEAGRAPKQQQLSAELQGNALNQLPGGAATLMEITANRKNVKVTRDVLAAYYRRGNLRPLRLAFTNPQTTDEQITRKLFEALDLNADDRLSRDELARAESSLRLLDLDDDEVVTTQEMLPDPFGGLVFVAPQAVSPGSTSAAFLLLEPGEPPKALSDRLLATYDRDKSGRLTTNEIALDRAAFARLDANGDGTLSAYELGRYRAGPPDLRFLLQLSKVQGKEWKVASFRPDGKPDPLAGAVAVKGPGAFELTLPGATFAWRLGRAGAAPNRQDPRRFYLGQFQSARKEGKAYVDEQDVQPSRFQFLRGLFALADRDGDGKLTEPELTAYLDLQAKAAGTALTFSIADSGRQLLPLMDGNRDGRLSPRELRAAWASLAPLDLDKDGAVGKTEVLRRFQVAVGPVQPQGPQRAVPLPPRALGPQAVRRTTAGPMWYRKMDRNGDGDLSPREFLGDPADFRRLDADGDGLISREEAEKAQAVVPRR